MNSRIQFTASQQQGMSLIELMIAMTIGIFLVGAVFAVYLNGKQTFRTSETIARLQDDARYALTVIRNDVRLAGFWGLNNNAENIIGRKGETDYLGNLGGDCEDGWYVDLDNFVSATNNDNTYDVCLADTDHKDNTDILVIRRADATLTTAFVAEDDGKVFLRSTSSNGELFDDYTIQPVMAADFEDRRLLTHAYYVRDVGDAGTQLGLQRIELIDGGANAAINVAAQNREIIPNVEEFQVQFGVDTNGDRNIDQYVDPGHANAVIDNILAVRVWILLRSENEFIDFKDTNTYIMGSRDVGPFNDGYRRFLASATIKLRNVDR